MTSKSTVNLLVGPHRVGPLLLRWLDGFHREFCQTWWTFRPRKKIFSPPPKKNPQFAADTLPTPRPLLETPPPCGIFDKKSTPPSRRPRTPPSPSPSRKKNKKYPKRPPSKLHANMKIILTTPSPHIGKNICPQNMPYNGGPYGIKAG